MPQYKAQAVNKIHSFIMASMTHPTQVTVSEWLDGGFRLNSSLACQLQNFLLQISALLQTLVTVHQVQDAFLSSYMQDTTVCINQKKCKSNLLIHIVLQICIAKLHIG